MAKRSGHRRSNPAVDSLKHFSARQISDELKRRELIKPAGVAQQRTAQNSGRKLR